MRPARRLDAPSNRPGVQSAADVRRLLAMEIENVKANPDLDPIQKARVVALLARAVLRAVRLETLDARTQAIESALKLRTDAARVEASEPAWQPRKGAHAKGAR